MVFRGQKILVKLVCPLFILIFILIGIRDNGEGSINHPNSDITLRRDDQLQHKDLLGDSNDGFEGLQNVLEGPTYASIHESHRAVFSISTADGKYFPIDFGQYATNPSIIPHPQLKNTWIIVAQRETTAIRSYMWFTELACNATFQSGELRCVDDPIILPIPPSAGLNCKGPLKYFADSVGPHDARVFYGPKAPQVTYGSNSAYTCFGQWMQDLRTLANSGFERIAGKEFMSPTELQRPLPYRPIEKNWFLFWDKDEQIYVHYDLWPNRGFVQLNYDGTIGPDLGPSAIKSDSKCMAKYMPPVSQELDPLDRTPLESVNQATNSLSITLCKRREPWCIPDNSNTFIMTIFQHKTYKWSHSVYEPYAMLFRQTAPFEIHAISTKSTWIHGRGGPGTGRKPDTLPAESIALWSQTEMFDITSLSWKNQGQKYHGYIDDIVFIAFGIENSKSAGIDVFAGDLLADLGLCSNS